MFTVTAGDLPLFGTDSEGVLWGVEDVDGWGVTASTASQTQRPRQGGAWSGGKYPKARAVTVSGSLTAPSPEAAQHALDRLGAAVSRYEFVLTIVETTSARWGLFYQTGELIPVWTSPTDVEWSFQVASDDWRKFGQELASSTALPSTTGGLTISTTAYEWVGVADASPSIMRYGGIEQRKNRIADPRGVTPSWWAAPGGSTLSTSSAGLRLTPSGTAGCYVYGSPHVSVATPTPNRFAITPGQSFSVGMTVTNPGSASVWVAVGCAFYDSAAAGGSSPSQIGARTELKAGATLRMEQRGTLPATATTTTGTLPLLYVYGTAAGGVAPTTASVDSRDWQFEIRDGAFDVAPTYFDGSLAETGGLTAPFTIDATTVTGQVSLVNPGNDSGPVRLRIDGPCVGPVVTHVSTGAQLTFASSLSLRAGEWLEVDMEARTVLANGQASRSGWITSRGWSQFDPGVNTWAFTAASFTSAARLTVTATPSWK